MNFHMGGLRRCPVCRELLDEIMVESSGFTTYESEADVYVEMTDVWPEPKDIV